MSEIDDVYMELTDRVSKGEAIQRLLINKDFESIILRDYLENTMSSLSYSLVSQHKPETRQAIIEQILSRGCLRNFLNMIIDDMNRAKIELSEMGN